MSICEGLQEAQGQILSLRRLQREIPSAGRVAIRSPAARTSRNQQKARRIAAEDVTDEMLLRSVADGDKAAMHTMFARHRTRVFRFVQRMVRNSTIAEDVVSQVFLEVWRSARAFENRARVSTWLLGIARFRALDMLRERTQESIDQDEVLDIADPGDTPEGTLDRKEASGVLEACMNRLSPAHREILDLFYYCENSIAEVSMAIGIPQATVKSRMFYARKHLARLLMDAGFNAAVESDESESAKELGAR
jgi:RNA polymerase sigma-70 factor (ECF subfamily)